MPAWSPDGLWIAYASSLAGGSFDVFVGACGESRAPLVGRATNRSPRGTRPACSVQLPGAGRLVGGEAEDGDHVDRPARAAARLRPEGAVPPARARTQLAFASATDNVGEGPIWIRGTRRRRPARWRPSSSSASEGGGVCSYPAPAAPLRPRRLALALAPARLPAYELRAPTTSLVARPQERLPAWPTTGASPSRVTAWPTGLPRQLRPGRAGCPPRRAGHLDRLHRPLPAALPRPELRAWRASPRAYVLVHRANPKGCSRARLRKRRGVASSASRGRTAGYRWTCSAPARRPSC